MGYNRPCQSNSYFTMRLSMFLSCLQGQEHIGRAYLRPVHLSGVLHPVTFIYYINPSFLTSAATTALTKDIKNAWFAFCSEVPSEHKLIQIFFMIYDLKKHQTNLSFFLLSLLIAVVVHDMFMICVCIFHKDILSITGKS